MLRLKPYQLCFSRLGSRILVVGKQGVAVLDFGKDPGRVPSSEICSAVSRVTAMVQAG